MHYDGKSKNVLSEIKQSILNTNQYFLTLGCQIESLERECFPRRKSHHSNYAAIISAVTIAVTALFYQLGYFTIWLNSFRGIRCLVPNNFIVYEATRPIEDCSYCINVTEATVVPNLTREEFAPYAYSPKPIVIKQGVLHWPAIQTFSFEFFKELYGRIDESYNSVDEECQFLHFKSDFIYFKDVLDMSEKRARNEPGEKSWYVGWGNCHAAVLEDMRRYYPKPHFLPRDCEMPSNDHIFMGYDDGASMHLDYIDRLTWQAQLQGTKIWELLPVYECENVCSPVSFVAEPGDAVLVDTRIWYHKTTIKPGELSISIQSEYG